MELLKNLEGLSADEQMTAVVELQKAAMKHLEEQKQASIGKSAELVIQGLKKIKSDFEAKFDSLNYDIQTKVASLKDGEQGLQGPKGDQGERGLDGANGRDGRDGKDGKDGVDGVDGVGVRDAKIDFDGSLVISLTDGREINCGEVVSVDVAKQIQKVTHNIQTGSGGDSQTVLDAIAALQATIATYGTMATQNANNVAITGGAINNTTIGATTPSTGVFTTLTAQNETLKGTGQNLTIQSQTFQNAAWIKQTNVTATDNATTAPDGSSTAASIAWGSASNGTGIYNQTSGSWTNLTNTKSIYVRADVAGGTVQLADPGTTVGTTTLTLTTSWQRVTLSESGQTTFAGIWIKKTASSPSIIYLWGGQLELGSTANTYIPTTTTAVYGTPTLSFSGVASLGLQSDGSLYETSAGTGNVRFYTNNIAQEQMRVSHTASAVNYVQVTGAATGSRPTISSQGSDTTLGLNIQAKGTSNINFLNNNGSNTIFVANGNAGTVVNYLQSTAAVASSAPSLSAQGSDTNIDLNLTPKGTGVTKTNGGLAVQSGSGTFPSTGYGLELYNLDTGSNFIQSYNRTAGSYLNTVYNASAHLFRTSGAEQLRVAHTASAVNYVQVTGAATGTPVLFTSQGSDASVPILFNAKGPNGYLNFTTESTGNSQLVIMPTSSAVNQLRITGSITGFGPKLYADGSDTNIPLVLQPKGTGALQAQQTDSTATGGNARGANAVDWQTSRTAASQVASGQYATASGGYRNTASGFSSTVSGGEANSNSGYIATISGGATNTSSGSYTAIAGGYLNTNSKDWSFLGAGYGNIAGGFHNFIGSGYSNSGTSASAVTTQSATMNGTTAVTLSGSNASIKVGQLITGTSIANFPNTYVAAISGTSLTLSQAASGSSTSILSFYTPHGVVVGGGNNQATGAYSFIGGGGDAGTAANRNVASGAWSIVGGGRGNTASGSGSFVGGGGTTGDNSNFGNTASGLGSCVVGGFANTASGQGAFIGSGYASQASGIYSFIGAGARATTRSIISNSVFSSNNPIADLNGASQAALLVLGVQTTDATATVLRSDAQAAGTTNQVILPNNSAYAFRGEIVSGVTGGGNSKSWTIEGLIKRGANAASTTLVGSTVTSMYADAGAVTWTIALSADTTNGGLAVTFTGQAATTIRTVAQIRTTEMTY